jgi:hypothetical protein
MKPCLPSIEYQIKPDDQLCFIHIPKTAGSTLISALDANFHVDQIRAPSSLEIVQNRWQSLTHVKLFRGHFTYAELAQAVPQNSIFLTMLRSPLNRTQSLYKYCKILPPHAQNRDRLMSAASGSFREFVFSSDPLIRDLISNGQTIQLASDVQHQSPDDMLAIAKQRLDQCLFVGLTEQFQLSILLLCYIFGWYPNLDSQALRVSPYQIRQQELEADLQIAIAEFNQLDYELYLHAQRWFGDRVSQMIAALSPQVSTAQSAFDLSCIHLVQLAEQVEHRYWQRLAEQRIEPFQLVDFDCSQPIIGKGWHRRNGRENGLITDAMQFRWTGPDTVSTISWPLSAATDLTIRVYVVNWAALDVLESLTLLVNHHPILLECRFYQNRKAVLVGQIPEAALTGNYPHTRFQFIVNRTVPLNEIHMNSTDSRLVGVAFSRIQIFPATALPGESNYLPLFFPTDDIYWNQAAQFVWQHQNNFTRLAAPEEFIELIPNDSYCHESLSLEAVCDRSQLTGLVIHKGRLKCWDNRLLSYAIQYFNLVFANPVFLVFFSSSNLSEVSYSSPHVKLLWKEFYFSCWRRQVQQFLHLKPYSNLKRVVK